MMTKLNKWVIRHPSLAYNIASIFELTVLVLLYLTFDWSIWLYAILGLVILTINKFSIATAAPHELNKAIKKLDFKCDPAPPFMI